jgi:hypothetical protein
MGKRINLAVGAGLAALLAGGAALYLTKTKSGKQAAAKIKSHAKVIGKKIATKAEKTKALTQKKYGKIVEDVMAEYAKDKKIASHTVKGVAKDLKSHWHEVKTELHKKPVKKAAKKKKK